MTSVQGFLVCQKTQALFLQVLSAVRMGLADLGQDDVVSQTADAVPRKADVRVAGHQTAHLALSRHDQRRDAPVCQIKLQIVHIPEPLTGFEIDDFLVSEIG